MPELPEVQTIVQDLKKPLEGKTFSKVIVHDPFVLRCLRKRFIQELVNHRIEAIDRRGKAIVIRLSSGKIVVVQLMMTGQLVLCHRKKDEVRRSDLLKHNTHTRISFIFSDGSVLLYHDQRRFGQWRLVGDLSEVKYFKILGPEPFSDDFTPAYIQEAINKTSRPIKNVLLDHTFVAGIGNIYACEILFRAGISPLRPARDLDALASTALYHQTRNVLKEAIDHRGCSMRNYRDGAGQKGHFHQRLSVYARQGLPCLRCAGSIKRLVQSGRSTFYCSRCQK